jgi:hypothetical protein
LNKPSRARLGSLSISSNDVSETSEVLNDPNFKCINLGNLNPPLVWRSNPFNFVNIHNPNEINAIAYIQYSDNQGGSWFSKNSNNYFSVLSNNISSFYDNTPNRIFRARLIGIEGSVSSFSNTSYANSTNLNSTVSAGFSLNSFIELFNPNNVSCVVVLEGSSDAGINWQHLFDGIIGPKNNIIYNGLNDGMIFRTRCADISSVSNSVSQYNNTYFNPANLTVPIFVSKASDHIVIYNVNNRNIIVSIESSNNGGQTWRPYGAGYASGPSNVYVYGSSTNGLLFRGRIADASNQSNSVTPLTSLS